MRQPSSVAIGMELDQMFRRDDGGKPVTREATCECGKHFTQRQLSERFLEIVDKQSRTAMKTFRAQVPDFFVPVHCSPCERKDLGRRARLADLDTSPRQPDFGYAAD